MRNIGRYELRGGSHDGERLTPSSPPPDTLFGITTSDGERYARSGDEVTAGGGATWMIFCFDPDGSATARARQRFGRR